MVLDKDGAETILQLRRQVVQGGVPASFEKKATKSFLRPANLGYKFEAIKINKNHAAARHVDKNNKGQFQGHLIHTSLLPLVLRGTSRNVVS